MKKCFILGDLYYNGKYGKKGDDSDYNTSRQWYEKAAENGYSGAYSSLGDMYRDGKGVDQDYKKAMDYYMKGVALGNSGAMNKVGYFYDKGYGADEPDYEQANEWYLKAA
ncbi:MAG: sel1 repeat family protein, partial [Solobacterium sp.]|nr:sel1 repeat family protein [Solobacterium sp.]